ncbi:uncharacterized protein LOC101241761 isoform X2 [Hydra vulgaris]|uniref:uncharacterized protein LOC101241761 isoform X2 n=1 Tax=Hydra vulgaris TaxID=6087 RepID=UPI001F5E5102|nr:uncharacterized protein LOC101241761 isoform X2 [Hydra vulgaris]
MCTKSENISEDQETTNKASRTNIVEISSDEKWVEEEEEVACCDNVTRTDRCAELKDLPPTVYGIIQKKRDVTPWTYARRLTPNANISTERSPTTAERSTPIDSLQHTLWTKENDHQRESNSASDEHFSEHANTSAKDVQTSTVSDTDTTAHPATQELRLSTLTPLLTTKIALFTCLSVISYIKSHITFDLDNIPDEQPVTIRQSLKIHQKQNFANYLFSHNIINARQYDDELANSDELRKLEFTTQLKDLEVIKKQYSDKYIYKDETLTF